MALMVAMESHVPASKVSPMPAAVVCEVRLHHVDLFRELSEVNLKLKFRVNGETYYKTKAQKGLSSCQGPSRLKINTICTSACDKHDVLQFELCSPGFLNASNTVACCAMPLATALSGMGKGEKGTYQDMLCLELYAKDNPDQVLAHLIAGISVMTSSLEFAGIHHGQRRADLHVIYE